MAEPFRPPADQEPGGCRDTLFLTRMAFEVMIPIIAVLFGGILAVVAFLYLLVADDTLTRVLAAVYLVVAVIVGILLARRFGGGPSSRRDV